MPFRATSSLRLALRLLLVAGFVALPIQAHAAGSSRLKELVTVDGFRDNELTGVGVVVGLAGTGDSSQSKVVKRTLASMLRRLGVRIDARDIKAENVAIVAVTARLVPFARSGMSLDVTVSSIGDADSLLGGTLLSTPLKGPNGRTYALAQGALSLGGFAIKGGSGSKTVKNHSTVGRIPSGGTVERDAPGMLPRAEVVLLLKRPDFTTASRIARAIDQKFGTKMAIVRDPASIVVKLSEKWRKQPVHFIAAIEAVEATPDIGARVVIDEKTGTVVVGTNVRLGPAAIAHGALTIRISETETPSQPGLLSGGATVVTRNTNVEVDEAKGDLHVINGATSVGDVAAALNALGAKPRDLVSIFQALRVAGALRAEIVVL